MTRFSTSTRRTTSRELTALFEKTFVVVLTYILVVTFHIPYGFALDGDDSALLIEKSRTVVGEELRGGNDYLSAIPVPLGKETRLDHHQRSNEYDYFFVDVVPGEAVVIEIKTREVGIRIDSQDNITETNSPRAAIELHNAEGVQIQRADISGKAFESKSFRHFANTTQRLFLLVGSRTGPIHKDYASFKVEKQQYFDADSDKDAGENLSDALPIEARKYENNSIIGNVDEVDTYYIETKANEEYSLNVFFNESPRHRRNLTVTIYDAYRVPIAKQKTQELGVSFPPFSSSIDGKIFFEIRCDEKRGAFAPYTLHLRHIPKENDNANFYSP